MTVSDGLPGGSSRLTPRERECLLLVLENRSSKAIARRLGISHTSVDTHIRRARAKLGQRDRYAAARLVEQWERQHSGAAASDPHAERRWPDTAPTIRSLVPPLETLGPWSRLGLVLATAIFIALIFGIVLNAMRAL
jgi:DNA-binding CsgD family transcriptional regulator